MSRGEEGFAEVAGDDLVWVADGGEVDAGVPAEEYIDVRRYKLQVGHREPLRFAQGRLKTGVGLLQEWFQELGDAGGLHSLFDCRWSTSWGRFASSSRR